MTRMILFYDTLLVGFCSEMDWMDVTRDITVPSVLMSSTEAKLNELIDIKNKLFSYAKVPKKKEKKYLRKSRRQERQRRCLREQTSSFLMGITSLFVFATCPSSILPSSYFIGNISVCLFSLSSTVEEELLQRLSINREKSGKGTID